MASVITESNGRRLIQLSPSEHPKRPKIRLGRVSKREAESVVVHAEAILRSNRTETGIGTTNGGIDHEAVGMAGGKAERL
jgi:F420-0:gamma-glutamyl ligase